MIRRSLLEHARRQWRTTHRLITRHRMVTHTDMGRQLVRGLDMHSGYAYATPLFSTRIGANVPPAAVDWDVDEQDRAMTESGQEFVQPTVQLPDEIALAPETPDLPTPDVSAPRVDPLVELVRRVRGQAPPEPVTPSAPSVPNAPQPAVDPLVEAVLRARGQAAAEPVESREPLAIQPAVDPLVEAVRQARGQTTRSEPAPRPLADVPQPASVTPAEPVSTNLLPATDDSRAARLSALRRRQPLGTRIVELPTGEQASDSTQPSRPATLSAPEKAAVPPTATPRIAEQERVLPTSFTTSAEVGAQTSQADPREESQSNTLAIEPDVLVEHGTSEPQLVDEPSNTSAENGNSTPKLPSSATPDWVDRLAKAARDQIVKPTHNTPLVDVETSSPALLPSEPPAVPAPRSTAPLSQVAVPPARGDALASTLASVPADIPTMRVSADTAGTMSAERVDVPIAPPSSEAVPSPAAALPPVVVVPEHGASPTTLLPVQPVADSARVQLAPSEGTPSDTGTTSVDAPVVHAEDATVGVGASETAIKAPADARQLEIPVEDSVLSTPGAADQGLVREEALPISTDHSAQVWAARLAQAAGLPEPIAEQSLDHVPLPFVAPATLADSNTSGAPAKPVVSAAQPVRATPSSPKDKADDPARSPSSAPDHSSEAWAGRMAALMHPPSAASPSSQQATLPSRERLQSQEAPSAQPRVVQPVEAMPNAQARDSAARAVSPAQALQRPRVGTPRVAENVPAASANVASSLPAPDDRSPGAWASRLFPTLQPTEQQSMPQLRDGDLTPPVHEVPASESQPTPVTETTRRFLQPLVGIDPGSVRVHTGVHADQLASSHRADAVTTGEDVLLANGNAGDSPEALGLLAHELTHVARTREPRFVPPMLTRARPIADEEALAQTVERQVTRAAQARQVQQSRGAQEIGASPNTTTTPDNASRIGQHFSLEATEDMPLWAGLPAPWEPLPSWIAVPTASEAALPLAPAINQQTSTPARVVTSVPAAASSMPAPTGGNGAAPAAQLAAIDRTEATEAISATPPASQEPPKQAAEPNLDVLARQVYSILKQRLAAERRRQG